MFLKHKNKFNKLLKLLTFPRLAVEWSQTRATRVHSGVHKT
jgi:hypothetical protein